MNLDEAIMHCDSVIKECSIKNKECAENHQQLKAWLIELKERREKDGL